MEKPRKVNEEVRQENDKAFLERAQVKEAVSEMLSVLTTNQPADPLKFMADYFRSTFEQSSRLDRCHKTILLTHHSSPIYQRNLATAFEILNQTKIAKNVHGINGKLYGELLDLLLHDVPSSASQLMKKTLSCRSYEVVTFEAFRYSITCIAVYKDFVQMSDELFSQMTAFPAFSGQLPKPVAETVISLLAQSVSRLSKPTPGPHLDACFQLSPDEISAALSKAKLGRSEVKGQSMTREQFREKCSETYLHLLSE